MRLRGPAAPTSRRSRPMTNRMAKRARRCSVCYRGCEGLLARRSQEATVSYGLELGPFRSYRPTVEHQGKVSDGFQHAAIGGPGPKTSVQRTIPILQALVCRFQLVGVSVTGMSDPPCYLCGYSMYGTAQYKYHEHGAHRPSGVVSDHTSTPSEDKEELSLSLMVRCHPAGGHPAGGRSM